MTEMARLQRMVRADQILAEMKAGNYLTQEQFDKALAGDYCASTIRLLFLSLALYVFQGPDSNDRRNARGSNYYFLIAPCNPS